jgi:hypothetical protein
VREEIHCQGGDSLRGRRVWEEIVCEEKVAGDSLQGGDSHGGDTRGEIHCRGHTEGTEGTRGHTGEGTREGTKNGEYLYSKQSH